MELTPSLIIVEPSSSLGCGSVYDLDRAGPSRTVEVAVSSDISSEEDPDEPSHPRTPFGGDSQQMSQLSCGFF